MMDVLKFLNSIRDKREEVNLLKGKRNELYYSLMPSGIRYDLDKVQTSPEDRMPVVAGDLDEILAATEGQGVHGAGLDAAGQLAFLEPVKAEGAFLDDRVEGLAVLEGGHVEGAGDHAVAAADALAAVVDDGAVGLLLVAFGEAGAGAGRIVAVEALLLAEGELAFAHVPLVDDSPRRGGGAAALVEDGHVGEGLLGRGQLVDPVAALFALAAADAAGHVVQNAVAVVIAYAKVVFCMCIALLGSHFCECKALVKVFADAIPQQIHISYMCCAGGIS